MKRLTARLHCAVWLALGALACAEAAPEMVNDAAASNAAPHAAAPPPAETINLNQVLQEAYAVVQSFSAVRTMSPRVSDAKEQAEREQLVAQADLELARAERLLSSGHAVSGTVSRHSANRKSPAPSSAVETPVVKQQPSAQDTLALQLETMQEYLNTFSEYLQQMRANTQEQNLGLDGISGQIAQQQSTLARVDGRLGKIVQSVESGQDWMTWASNTGILLFTLGVLGLLGGRLLRLQGDGRRLPSVVTPTAPFVASSVVPAPSADTPDKTETASTFAQSEQPSAKQPDATAPSPSEPAKQPDSAEPSPSEPAKQPDSAEPSPSEPSQQPENAAPNPSTPAQQARHKARIDAALRIVKGAAQIDNTGAANRALQTLREIGSPEDVEQGREIVREQEKA